MGNAESVANRPRILVVDDHESVRTALGKALRQRGWEAGLAADARQALALLREGRYHAMVVDVKMPGMDGLELMRAARAVSPGTEVVVITAYGTVERAVEAMKLGAVDFVAKPFRRAVLMDAVGRALARQCLPDAPRPAEGAVPEIVGRSAALREAVQLLCAVAPSSAAVLLTGESGTGKELAAEAVHRFSPRRDAPLVKVSCAALPETLLESELFGHVCGAFTGAGEGRKGRFEVADGGTIFLDEIAQLSPAMQAKLLRVLQDGRFERVGSSETVRADVRVVAATNADLADAVAKGAFREDLYYRLNVVAIHMPPLRQRAEDVPLLAQHFLALFCERDGCDLLGITQEALDALMHYAWPGNVRELQNVVERAVLLAHGDRVALEDLPERIRSQEQQVREVSIPVGTTMREAERRLIEATLRHTSGDKSAAAGLLGIARRTIYRKLGGRGKGK